MISQSPSKSWEEPNEVLREVKDGYGGRPSELDLNKVATKVDEAEMDDYDSQVKERQWPEGTDQDMGNSRPLGISPPPEQTERSPSPKRSLSPDAKLPLSPARRVSVSPNRTQPGTYTEVRSTSPRRSCSPSPRRGSPSVRRTSLSPNKRYTPPVAGGRKERHYRERSWSRSPVGKSDRAVSPYNRRYGGRSPSRSPPPRDNRYSPRPRGRSSPRHRFSPPNYRFRRGRSPRRRPWSPPANRSTGYGKPGNNLFIAGFSFDTTERDLERKFSRFGRVTDVRIVRDRRSGDSRGFGFLSLERDEDADAAIKSLDQTEWNGRIVLVEKAKTRTRYDR